MRFGSFSGSSIFRPLQFLGLWLLAGCGPVPEARVAVHEAWIKEGPPVHKMAAAYMRLENLGAKAVALIAIELEQGRAELHYMRHQDGVMQMGTLERLDLAPGQSVSLQPSGTHIMLLDLPQAPRAGQQLPLKLIFAGGYTRRCTALVKRPEGLHQ
ncbi:MAG: copper chaperone PCu(A)C [Candidatus Latescibacteria bacterium]|nr:copper chaperone PCu(A)C [Candidatus Latescibacterota bacterium]